MHGAASDWWKRLCAPAALPYPVHDGGVQVGQACCHVPRYAQHLCQVVAVQPAALPVGAYGERGARGGSAALEDAYACMLSGDVQSPQLGG